MQAVVGGVVPPFAVLIDEFALAFQEVGMMLGLPPNTVAVVGEGAVVGIPIGDDAAVAAEGTQVHDRNRADGIETGGVHRLVQAGVDTRFRPGIGQPTFRVGVV